MTAATGLKRLGIGIVAVVAAGVALLAAMSFIIHPDTVRDAVKNEIRAVTGLDPVLRGPTSISLFPSGRAGFADVVLGDDRKGQAALIAEQITAKLRLLPLLFGRIEIADVALVRPTIVVAFQPDGRSNWSGLLETLARTLKPNRGTEDALMSFSEIRVTDGTVLVRDDRRKVLETISNVEMSLAWPAIAKSFGATGQFVWRNEPITGSFSLGDLLAALSGERSSAKLRLTGTSLKVAFDGTISTNPTIRVEGMLAADTPSFRDALRLVTNEPLPGGGFGPFTLKAQAAATPTSLSLSNVNIELDGNVAEGALSISGEGRPMIQGTLATNELDLTPYVSTFRFLRANEREWNRGDLSVEGLDDFDLDLRLSAGSVALSSAKLGRTAVAANLRDAKFTITIGEAQAFNGVIKGSLGLAKAAEGANVKANVNLIGVDLDACLTQLFGIRRLEGKGDLALAIDATGDSVFGLARSLDGTVTLDARNGALTGFNVEQLLRRLERRPLSGGGDFRNGRTPFERLTVTLRITDGDANVEDVRLDGTSVTMALGGVASIPARDLDLKGTASLAAASEGSGFELPFVVQGSWDDPIMLPDPQILIRRSGAAAPLLDAVRGRTRDAVRSAIEQLTNRGASSPAAPPVPVQ